MGICLSFLFDLRTGLLDQQSWWLLGLFFHSTDISWQNCDSFLFSLPSTRSVEDRPVSVIWSMCSDLFIKLILENLSLTLLWVLGPLTMSYTLVNNGTNSDKFHRGSAPTLLLPPRYDGLGPRPMRKRLSVDVLRNRTPELGPMKWPSLVTICKWKKNLTERLLKRRHGNWAQVSTNMGFGLS